MFYTRFLALSTTDRLVSTIITDSVFSDSDSILYNLDDGLSLKKKVNYPESFISFSL